MNRRTVAWVVLAIAQLGFGTGWLCGADKGPVVAPETAVNIIWQTDYRAALAEAQAKRVMAFLWFVDPHAGEENEKFAKVVLSHSNISRPLESLVCIKLPIDAKLKIGQENITLLDHEAFAEMLHRPGVAMIDMCDKTSPCFHHVVSVFPFTSTPISQAKLAAMLGLPRGSLTQRTLIWAVRTHPDHPQSAGSPVSDLLMQEAERHATHQASIQLQGHHNWENRFHAINARLSGGLVAQEVCAESWPGERLIVAAEECVNSWRQSSGHWEAVSSRQALIGYDMKLGSNGIWYGTGIFAK